MPHTYAALDLGTNNCRLLIAQPSGDSFRIIDSFSRIVRLGEGIGQTGMLSKAAMDRTLAALDVCRGKILAQNVDRMRLVATQACRAAENSFAFCQRVKHTLGLDLEIIDRKTEAELAARGCASLVDPDAEDVILFDIGGGSTEIVRLEASSIAEWLSLPIGVVTLAEHHGGVHVDEGVFEAMRREAEALLIGHATFQALQPRGDKAHLLGTSGTVTTLAGVHLNLGKYERRQIDGLWMSSGEITKVVSSIKAMPYEARVQHGCIGLERADLVLAGCAILEAIRTHFPDLPVRIADRGLREGILVTLMQEDRLRA